MSKRKYTEAIHAERLLKIIEKDDPCGCCPAAKYFNEENSPLPMWDLAKSYPCRVCLDFLGIGRGQCPCIALENPIELTIQKLKEKGYV